MAWVRRVRRLRTHRLVGRRTRSAATSQGALLSAAVAAASGIAVLDILDRLRRTALGRNARGAPVAPATEDFPTTPVDPVDRRAASPEGVGTARRRFLAVGAGAATWAAVAPTVGRWLGPSDPDLSSELVNELTLTDTPSVPDSSTLDQIDGMASYITPNDDFYLIDTALRPPVVDPADWSLRISGMVDDELEITFEELLSMELEEPTSIDAMPTPDTS